MSEIPLSVNKTSAQRQRVQSIVLVNTGDGKGKSSSAFGVMGRAWARGWKIGVVQFIKGADWETGERKLAEHLGIEWHTMGDGFTWDSDDLEASKRAAGMAWQQAETMLKADYRLVILDEITYCINWNWIDGNAVATALGQRSPQTNVIATGRDAPSSLIDIANTVTDMTKVKHAFDEGIIAIKGIEY